MKTAILNASARVLCKDAATYGDAFEKIQRHIIDIRSKKDKLETKQHHKNVATVTYQTLQALSTNDKKMHAIGGGWREDEKTSSQIGCQ